MYTLYIIYIHTYIQDAALWVGFSPFCHVTCNVLEQFLFEANFVFSSSQSVSVVLSPAKAMANPALTDDAVSPGAVAWVLTSTAFVFLMTAGLGFFYGGLVRDTNIINTMMMSVVSMGIVTLTWMVFGFSWAFGDNGSTGFGMFVGNFDYSLWMGLDMKMWGDSGLPGLVFAAFQMTFAIISSAIISGSLVERMRFSAYCIMLALWSLLIYAPLCHWVWGPGGWIGEMGALDFAGGTVVHISSGVSGLVAGGILGPRRHVEKDLGPANVPFVILGGCLLWFGWLGFNGGSALSVTDGVAARAVATTFVASASSMLTWLAFERVLKGKSTSVGASVGAVAGKVWCWQPVGRDVFHGFSIVLTNFSRILNFTVVYRQTPHNFQMTNDDHVV